VISGSLGNQPNQHDTIHVDVGHLGYATNSLSLNFVSDNEQLIVLLANDPPLVVV